MIHNEDIPNTIQHAVREPAPCKLTLKVVSESRVTWATSVPILVFLGLSVLDLGPMYTTDDMGRGHNNATKHAEK